MAYGAEFTFLGRSFMYSVAALGHTGHTGGDHMMALLKTQLKQVMEQIGCEGTNELNRFLIKNKSIQQDKMVKKYFE